jgi:hypothetical protein
VTVTIYATLRREELIGSIGIEEVGLSSTERGVWYRLGIWHRRAQGASLPSKIARRVELLAVTPAVVAIDPNKVPGKVIDLTGGIPGLSNSMMLSLGDSASGLARRYAGSYSSSALHETPGNSYGVIRVDPVATLKDLRSVLISSSPTSEPLETFTNVCPKVLVVPTAKRWILWADRTFDIAIAAFPDSHNRDVFMQNTPNWITLPTVADALRFVIRPGDRLDNDFFRAPMARNQV